MFLFFILISAMLQIESPVFLLKLLAFLLNLYKSCCSSSLARSLSFSALLSLEKMECGALYEG